MKKNNPNYFNKMINEFVTQKTEPFDPSTNLELISQVFPDFPTDSDFVKKSYKHLKRNLTVGSEEAFLSIKVKKGEKNELQLQPEKFNEFQRFLLTNSKDFEIQLRKRKDTYDIFFPAAFSAAMLHFFSEIDGNWEEFKDLWKKYESYNVIAKLANRKSQLIFNLIVEEERIPIETIAIRIKNLSLEFERTLNTSSINNQNYLIDSPFIYPISSVVKDMIKMIISGEILKELAPKVSKLILTDDQFTIEKIKEILKEETLESNYVAEVLFWISAFCIAANLRRSYK